MSPYRALSFNPQRHPRPLTTLPLLPLALTLPLALAPRPPSRGPGPLCAPHLRLGLVLESSARASRRVLPINRLCFAPRAPHLGITTRVVSGVKGSAAFLDPI